MMKLRSGNQYTVNPNDKSAVPNDRDEYDNECSIHMCRSSFDYVIITTHLTIILYVTCFFIHAGALPFLSKPMAMDVTLVGVLQVLFAFVQLCAALIFGRFGDEYGGKAALIMAFAPAAFSYGLMAIAYACPFLLLTNSVPLMCLSMLPSIFRHAMLAGQIVLTDRTGTLNRADAFGKLGVSYSIGMVLGTYIGGMVNTNMGDVKAAILSCVGSLFCIALVAKVVPARTKRFKGICTCGKRAKSYPVPSYGWSFLNPKRVIAPLRGNSRALILLVVKTITAGLPLGLWQGIIGMVESEAYGLKLQEIDHLMWFMDIFAMIIRGFGIGLMANRISENTLIKWASFTLIWSWLLMAYVQNVWQLIMVMMPMYIGLIILNVVIRSAITKTVSTLDTGAMLGINLAIESVIRTISPPAGRVVLSYLGFGYFECMTSIAITIYLFTKIK